MSTPSPRPTNIRSAQATDLDDLLALERASFTGDRLQRRQFRHLLGSPSAVVRVAVAGGDLIGSSVLLFRRTSRVARLYSIAVSANARGRGIGRALLADAEHCARRHGCARLRLEVRADNRVAQTLYESAGFARTTCRPDYYEDGTEAWVYELELDD